MNLVLDFLKNKLKLNNNDSIVIGVSAGPDSMCLLYLLLKLREELHFQIIVAHINHNVRVESEEEERFLKNYCTDHNVIFEKLKIEEYGKENFHAYARNIRYKFYEDLIKKYNAKYLMTAHHGDDLIETILMRLVRGSNLAGYQGIPMISQRENYLLVRPLLFVTKDEIKKFDDLNNILYRIDKSNTSSKYTRNRYRMKVLPFLKEENKDVHLKFLKFSNMLESATKYLEKVVDITYNRICRDKKLNIREFLKEDDFIKNLILEKLLKNIYNDLSCLEEKHLVLLKDFIFRSKTGSTMDLPLGVHARINYGYLSFVKKEIKKDYCVPLEDGLILPNGFKFIKLESIENGNDTLHLDSSLVSMPLYVRNKRDGDFIELKGTNGKRKVSDIFIDLKVNREDRNSYPIVVDSKDKIIWIPKLKKSKYDSKNYEKCDIIFKCL